MKTCANCEHVAVINDKGEMQCRAHPPVVMMVPHPMQPNAMTIASFFPPVVEVCGEHSDKPPYSKTFEDASKGISRLAKPN